MELHGDGVGCPATTMPSGMPSSAQAMISTLTPGCFTAWWWNVLTPCEVTPMIRASGESG